MTVTCLAVSHTGDTMAATKWGQPMREKKPQTVPHTPTAFVYGNIPDCGGLLFIPKEEAVELAALHQALDDAKTWGEFRARVAPRFVTEVNAIFAESDEPLPEDAEPFAADNIWGYSDGDWPESLSTKMFQWVPKSIQQKYGWTTSSVYGEKMLELEPGLLLGLLSMQLHQHVLWGD